MMKIKFSFAAASISVLLITVGGGFAQKKAAFGRVCGDPAAPCKYASDFQPYDLAFNTGNEKSVIFESEKFYGIVLRSTKLNKSWGDCEDPQFPESERLPIQELFPNNKVFAQNCVDAGTNYYTGVTDQTAFIGVFAGRTLAEANKFLKQVQATGKFPGVRVRRMQVGINGT